MSKQFEAGSIFEDKLKDIESALDDQFGPKVGARPVDNLRILRILSEMTKFDLESFLSKVTIISLNDEEYERLKEKIASIIIANENAAEEQRIKIDQNKDST